MREYASGEGRKQPRCFALPMRIHPDVLQKRLQAGITDASNLDDSERIF
jgi:hypothetical protein